MCLPVTVSVTPYTGVVLPHQRGRRAGQARGCPGQSVRPELGNGNQCRSPLGGDGSIRGLLMGPVPPVASGRVKAGKRLTGYIVHIGQRFDTAKSKSQRNYAADRRFPRSRADARPNILLLAKARELPNNPSHRSIYPQLEIRELVGCLLVGVLGQDAGGRTPNSCPNGRYSTWGGGGTIFILYVTGTGAAI